MSELTLNSPITTLISLSSVVGTTINLRSAIEVDYYGDLQETTLPFKVVQEEPEYLPDRRIRPPRVNR
jgi:hypothetical protein